jgi:CPA2 family monovalent cation:H+ antiporter-2
MLISAISNTLNISQLTETARALNIKIELLVRTHNEEETTFLVNEGVEKVFLGEHELAKNMSNYVLKRYGKV